jgi:hypothetical protein
MVDCESFGKLSWQTADWAFKQQSPDKSTLENSIKHKKIMFETCFTKARNSSRKKLLENQSLDKINDIDILNSHRCPHKI